MVASSSNFWLSTPPPIGGTKTKEPPKPTTYVGSVKLNSLRVGRDAGRIAEEILNHLNTLPGSHSTITLEVEVNVPGGVDSDVVRIVLENANTLGFQHSSFED